MKSLPACIPALLFCLTLNAQTYFQQEVNYKINVSLDDVKNELNADENITYTNHSPDILNFLYFHLWPNAYRDNNTALAKQLLLQGNSLFYYAPSDERGYIDQLDFKVNGKPVKLEYDSLNADIAKIYLNEPLKPGASIHITTPFHVKIPKGIFSRLGHLDQAYQITQWYPKPAVYDKNGWNPIPYLNQGEFYSEFGSYDVAITLPANYVVGATGDLVDGEKEETWMNEKVKETKSIEHFSEDMSFPPSDTEKKTLHYHQVNIHDFAWFADKRFHVLKGEVTLPGGHKVHTWAMFTNANAKLWLKSIEYLDDAITYYSKWNGEYPYNQVTAVDGALTAGAGMEYPNITVIGTVQGSYELETTIVHEVGHNWFYGMLGSNERMHAWMDEGINSFYETRYMLSKYPDKTGESEVGDLSHFKDKFNLNYLNHKKYKELSYLFNATRNLDQPSDLPAALYTDANYSAVVYDKSTLVFFYLKAYLGEELFDRCMHRYFETWKYKHPQPEDIQQIFEKESGKKLDWFFRDLLKTDKKLDYSIRRYKGDSVLVKNKTGLAGPFSIGSFRDGKAGPVKWYDGFNGKRYVQYPVDGAERLKIDPDEDMPEINRQNNTLYTSGLFPRLEPVKFQPFFSIPNPDKTEIYIMPVSGFNEYDKYMDGVLLYNSVIPFKPFEYELMPLYAFGSGRVNGGGNIAYHLYPLDSWAQSVSFGVKFEHFSYDRYPIASYYKFAPEMAINLRQNDPTGKILEQIKLRFIVINRQDRDDSLVYEYDRNWHSTLYNEISYNYADRRKINPYSIKISSEAENGDYLKGMAEGNYRITYPKGKGIDLRLFGGYFLNSTNVIHPFQLSGFSGNDDYRFDDVFIGRSQQNGLFSQQFSEQEGAFKVLVPLTADKWLASLNLKAAFPGRLPVGLFFDAVSMNNLSQFAQTSVLYDLGAYISVGGIIEIFFPFTYSSAIDQFLPLSGYSYTQKIRFTLNLSRLNPFEALRNLSY